MPGCAGDRFLKRPQLWKGVHYDVLRRDVPILRIDCRGLECVRNSHGCDEGFLDPAVEWDCIVDDSPGNETHQPGVLTDQITARVHSRERGYDNRRTSHKNEESDCSSDQGDGRPIWIDGAGCRKGHPGTEGVDARIVGAECFRESHAAASHRRIGKPSLRRNRVAGRRRMNHEGPIRRS
jgi:hypothetical protein